MMLPETWSGPAMVPLGRELLKKVEFDTVLPARTFEMAPASKLAEFEAKVEFVTNSEPEAWIAPPVSAKLFWKVQPLTVNEPPRAVMAPPRPPMDRLATNVEFETVVLAP